MQNRTNNFDFIRLILATLVIIAHSYPLTGEPEILSVITDGQIGFGGLAIDCFFILSGYFIFVSLQRSKNLGDYFLKRILRLYPALIVLMLFTLILVPFVYEGNYLISTLKGFWKYASGCLSLYAVKYYIPGVFENNPYPKVLNGSLWSLSYEFTMYLLVSLLFFIRKNKIVYAIIGLACLLFYFLSINNESFGNSFFNIFLLETKNFYKLAAYFCAGSFLTYFDLKKINILSVRIILTVLVLISLFLHWYPYVSIFLMPPLIMFLGLLATPYISSLSEKVGDISYGVYIYGFLIQQTVMHFFSLSSTLLSVVSILITYVCAYLSWHFVEEKMLRYKKLIR